MPFRSIILCGLLASAALAAGPEQIHLSYTGKLGELSVDFVCAAGGAGSVGFSVDGKKTWAQANATFLTYASIGDLQQALISPEWTPAPGAALSYYCACADGSKSGVFDVTPVPARYPSEVFVVFGDFGLVNDVSMASLISDATIGHTILRTSRFGNPPGHAGCGEPRECRKRAPDPNPARSRPPFNVTSNPPRAPVSCTAQPTARQPATNQPNILLPTGVV